MYNVPVLFFTYNVIISSNRWSPGWRLPRETEGVPMLWEEVWGVCVCVCVCVCVSLSSQYLPIIVFPLLKAWSIYCLNLRHIFEEYRAVLNDFGIFVIRHCDHKVNSSSERKAASSQKRHRCWLNWWTLRLVFHKLKPISLTLSGCRWWERVTTGEKVNHSLFHSFRPRDTDSGRFIRRWIRAYFILKNSVAWWKCLCVCVFAHVY